MEKIFKIKGCQKFNADVTKHALESRWGIDIEIMEIPDNSQLLFRSANLLLECLKHLDYQSKPLQDGMIEQDIKTLVNELLEATKIETKDDLYEQ